MDGVLFNKMQRLLEKFLVSGIQDIEYFIKTITDYL